MGFQKRSYQCSIDDGDGDFPDDDDSTDSSRYSNNNYGGTGSSGGGNFNGMGE